MKDSELRSQDGAPQTTVRQKALLVVFGLGLFLLLFFLVEGSLILFGLGDPRIEQDPFVGFAPGRDLFQLEQRPGGDIYVTHPDKLAFFNHQEFPREKKPGTYRIFALGGSTTAGRPYDARVAFPRWLKLYLEAADPSHDYEVINAGAISYASYRIVILMQELVRYEPDLFVLYTGHNEFLEERSYADIIHQNSLVKQLQFWLDGFRFFTLAKQGWRQLQPVNDQALDTLPAEVNAKLDGWTGLDLYERDEDLERSIVEHFAYNLSRLTEIARRNKVELITVVPASNLKDFSPFKSQPSDTLDEGERERFRERLEKGRAALSGGQITAARELLEEAVHIDPEYAEAHFRLGRAAFAGDDQQSAQSAFIEAKDQDVAPLRAIEPIVEKVRSVIGEASLPLIDLPRLLETELERRFGHRITGNEDFLDHVHPDLPIHSRIAEEVINILIDQGRVQRSASWTPSRNQDIYDREIAALDRHYYAQRDLNLAKVLGWSGKLEEAEEPLLRALRYLEDHPEVHLNLGIVYQRTGRLQQATRALERSIELQSDLAETHFNLGVVRGQIGDLQGGIQALERALELRPDYPEAQYNLGILKLERGSPQEAISALETTLATKGETAAVLSRLGRAYRRAGRLDDALRTFRRQQELDPNSVAVRLDLGITLAKRGRLDAAESWLRQAVEGWPENAEAHYNLGLLLATRGQTEAAIAAYRQALEQDSNHPEALNNLAIQLAGRGDLESARRLLDRAIEVDPDYADAYFNQGVVYDASGRPQDALDRIEKAISLDPDQGRFHFALGALYAGLGEAERAREPLRRAEELGVQIPETLRQQD